MPVIAEDPTGAESELSFTLRNYKGMLALSVGGQTVTPQAEPRQVAKQVARWVTKVVTKYTADTKHNPSEVGEVEVRGYGIGLHPAAVKCAFPKATIRVVCPTPTITARVASAAAGGAYDFSDAGFVVDQRPWTQTASTTRMAQTHPLTATLTHPNYANLAMYCAANGDAAIRTLQGDPLLKNGPELRVFSRRTLELLKAIADGAEVGIVHDLAPVYGGRPFVLVAPGPSLDVAEVKRLQAGGAVIMALWQALEKLNAGGVVPNLAVALDPSSLMLTKYKGGRAGAILCDSMAVQDFWKLGMPTYLFNVRSAHLHQNLWIDANWYTLSDQSQTASEASVWLAMLLGASSLLVMGTDYATDAPADVAAAQGNHIPCAGSYHTQWHYVGACQHMLQLAMALTHGNAGTLTRAPDGAPAAYWVAGGLLSHMAKLWGLVLPIMPDAKSLDVTEGSLAGAPPQPVPIAKAYPGVAANAKRLLKVAASSPPKCHADLGVLSRSLHKDFSNPTNYDISLIAGE